MSTGTILLIVVFGSIATVLGPFFAFVGGSVANQKGRNRTAWLLACALFFPTLILLFLLPRKKSPKVVTEGDSYCVRFLRTNPS